MQCFTRCVICCLAALASAVQANDLYRVTVTNSVEATRLRQCQVQGLVRLSDGFLVLADRVAADRLAQSGLEAELIASDVSRESLCLERSREAVSISSRRLLFEDKGVRVGVMNDRSATAALGGEEVILLVDTVAIEYREPRVGANEMLSRLPALTLPLDSLIRRISKDSLISTLRYLQSLPPRVVGSASMLTTRDWLDARLRAYGVDSVAIDSFGILNGTGFHWGWNVVGYKFGSRFPNHRVVFQAHQDAVANCPGADDDGSGTVATLEIARALLGVETDMTIVFGFGDGEEAGLWGSKYHAYQCKARGDSVVYVMPLDMIGEITNTDTVIAYANPPLDCTQLFVALADSLVDLTALIQPMIPSDGYPFDQAGYETAFIEEHRFSPQYHRPNDSTTYIDFDYMTRVTQSSLATAYTISQTAWPEATLAFSFPDGIPSVASSSSPVSFEVIISSVNGGGLVPGTELLIWQNEDGSRETAPLAPLGSGRYRATLPPLACGERALFCLMVDDTMHGTLFDCDTTWPHLIFGATNPQRIFEDNFETNKGWTVATQCYQNAGAWERGMPAGAGFRKEAVLDFDNSGQCYQTGNRFYQQIHFIIAGYSTLTSPVLALQGADAIVHLALLYSNATNNASHTYTPYDDTLFVFVRNAPTQPWQKVFTLGPVFRADGGWYEYTFQVGDYVTPSSTVQVMIAAEDTHLNSLVEAALDDFWVMRYDCDQQAFCCSGTTGNVNGSGIVDLSDLSALVSYLTGSGFLLPCVKEANVNTTGIVDLSDLSALVSYLTGGGYVLPNCP